MLEENEIRKMSACVAACAVAIVAVCVAALLGKNEVREICFCVAVCVAVRNAVCVAVCVAACVAVWVAVGVAVLLEEKVFFESVFIKKNSREPKARPKVCLNPGFLPGNLRLDPRSA